jgi:tetratricopeptide (TPR) repeat protein
MSLASRTAPMDDDDTANLDPALAEWHRMACALADDLIRLPTDDAQVRQVRLARAEPPLSIARALLDVASSCARSDPARATTLARLAIVAAEEMDHPDLDRRAGLLATAFCRLADALRHAGRYPDAERAFARAASYLSTTAQENLEARALYLVLLAELRFAQDRDEEADDLLCQAEILEENSGRPAGGAGSIVTQVEGC